MDAAKKKAVVKWTGIGLAVVAGLAIAGFATFMLAARSFSQSDSIAQGVSIEGIDVGGQTQMQAIQTIETQWLPGLPDVVTLSLVEADDLPAPGGQEPVDASGDEPVMDPAGDEVEEPAEEASASEEPARAERKAETLDLTPEELGVRPQVEKAAAGAYRLGREGSLWQQAVEQLRIKRQGIDLEIEADVDEAVLRATVEGLREKIKREPKNAKVSLSGDNVSISPGRAGRVLDVDASVEHLLAALSNPMLDASELVVKERQPEITQEMVAGFQTVLARYSTPFNPAREDRTHNLRLAMGMVNEKVVKPGERFSANAVIGQRLEERGYKAAPIFLEGEVVPSTGGGVCQVATTLYNAMLLANLQVNERRPHSRPVDYCPAGRDATLYYGQVDLKFTNTLKHPILIFGYIEGSRLHAVVIGHKDDKYDVELIRSDVSTIAYTTKEQPDPELEEGKRVVEKPGRNGARATLTRVVSKDGKEISRKVLHSDVYGAQAEIVRVGTKKPEEKPAEDETPAAGPSTKPSAPATKPAEKPADSPAQGSTPPAGSTTDE